MKVRVLMAMGALLGLSLLACATEFLPVGFESMSMGGAGVASARGSMAGYYNPALLATSPNNVEVTVGGGVGIRDNNLGEHVDRLSDLDLTNALSRVAANAPAAGSNPVDSKRLQEAQGILTTMGSQHDTLGVMPSASLGVQVRNIAVGAYLTADAGAIAHVKNTHTALIVEKGGAYFEYVPATDSYNVSNVAAYNATSLEFALKNGLTYMELKGLATLEVPISYARRIPVPIGTLAVGASVKPMWGMTYNSTAKIDTNTGDIQDKLDSNDKTSTAIGVDFGAYYEPPMVHNVRFGLVGKNLNNPKFDLAGGGEIEASSMWRAGVAWAATKKIDFAADLDLTKNARFDGTESQYIGGGVNIHPAGGFSFRVGAMSNLQDSDEGLIGTVGLGIGAKQFQFDLSAQASFKQGTYKGNDIPRYARINAALVSRW